MKLILLGAPGAGKGTQAEILCRELSIPTISTGNILRAAIKNGTPTGLKAKSYMDAGQLVPDDVIIGIVTERLTEDDCKNGYILDGVPRTIAQAAALEKAGITFDDVISIEISDETIMERMSGRRVCESCGASYHMVAVPPKQEGVCDKCGGRLVQRKDDAPETVKARLEVYHKETEPLKDFPAYIVEIRGIQPHLLPNARRVLHISATGPAGTVHGDRHLAAVTAAGAIHTGIRDRHRTCVALCRDKGDGVHTGRAGGIILGVAIHSLGKLPCGTILIVKCAPAGGRLLKQDVFHRAAGPRLTDGRELFCRKLQRAV